MKQKTVWISIGNSDNKLTQGEWAHFVEFVRGAVHSDATHIHADAHSAGDAPWQNAHFCFELSDTADGKTQQQHEKTLRAELARCARTFGQDSIAWLEGTTEFITGEVSK